jgi:hypothetical protein
VKMRAGLESPVVVAVTAARREGGGGGGGGRHQKTNDRIGANAANRRWAQQSMYVPAESVARGSWKPGIIADVTTFTHGELLELEGESEEKESGCRAESKLKHLSKDGKHCDFLYRHQLLL